ncbi:MAG: hypothetical protein GY780_14385, partial [bacterium]|nr:hypothetical protein [bacterium]
MKIINLIITIFIVVLATVAFAGGSGNPVTEAESLAVIDPVNERSCIALRVEVPEGQAVAGVRWFNGSAEQAFPKILVASGLDDLPPSYDEALVLAENVTGQENSWSEVEFNEPVASLNGSLFVILQYPAFYTPPEDGVSMGVGYREFEGENNYYLSKDGNHWFCLSSNYDFLLTPVYVAGEANVVALSSPGQEGAIGVNEATEALPIKTSVQAYPNPFNPEITIKLRLKESAAVELKIYDLK